MTYRWLELARSALLALVVGCSAQNPPPPGDGGAPSIQFDDSGVLTLTPSQTATIGLSANVSGVTVSLAGDYLDAFLDSDSVNLVGGHGTFTLHAPSMASTFSLLAVAGETTARLDVAVSAVGFASIRVTMNYEGKRPVPIVAASTFIETTCAQLGGAAVDGSPLVVGTDGEELLIPSVPTDGQVAVNVRIAHFATGCVDVPSLTPNETHDVTVSVFDLPFDLTDTALETRSTFAPNSSDAAALASYFSGTVSPAVLSASFPVTGSEAQQLLDTMASSSTSPSEFATARSDNGWDGITQTWLSGHPPTLSTRVSNWLSEASQQGIGDLIGRLAGDPAQPVFTPEMMGTLTASTAGLSAPVPFTWTGEPGDILSISGAVAIVPSQLACTMADLSAQTDVPTSTGVASALGIKIDCTGLATALAQGGYAFGTCDASCMDALCETALTTVWSGGATALAQPSDVLTLSLSISAAAQVGEVANVESYLGAWVGSFAYSTSKIGTGGVAKGAYGTVPN